MELEGDRTGCLGNWRDPAGAGLCRPYDWWQAMRLPHN